MPEYTCAVAETTSSDDCIGVAGTLGVAFVAKVTDIDWDNMTLTGSEVGPPVLAAGGSIEEYAYESEDGTFDSLYTSANGYEEVNVNNLRFLGSSSDNSVALDKLKNCCVVAWVFDAQGKSRLVGKEHVGTEWVDPIRKMKVVRKLDTNFNSKRYD